MTETSNIFSPSKRENYYNWLKEKGIQVSQRQIIPRTTNTGQYPLSFAQQRLWFLDQMDPGSPTYNISYGLRLKGPLSVTTLERSINEIIRRHEALRTTIKRINGQPFQFVFPSLNITISVKNLSGLPDSEREAKIGELFQDEANMPFELAIGPLVRATVIRLEDEEHIMLLTMHHIISDGWSMGIFFRELSELYEAFSTGKPSSLPELPIQYADFALWQKKWLTGEVLEKHVSYWRGKLDGAPPSLNIPTDYPRPEIQTYNGRRQSIEISNSIAAELRALSHREGVTVYMTLLTVLTILLHRYTGQDDIVMGSPIACRNRPEIEGLIGFFVNTMVLRTDLSGNPTFRELLSRVRSVALDAYEHQDLPFEKLVEEIQPQRDLSRTPLFQVFFNMINVPDFRFELTGITWEKIQLPEVLAKFDFTLYVREQNEGINLDLVYNTDLFTQSSMVELLAQLRLLFSQVVKNPDQKIDHFSLVTPTSKGFLPNPTEPLRPNQGEVIFAQFSDQARRLPRRTAVLDHQDIWTYRELELRSNQLANYLISSGIEPRQIIAIYGHRSASLVWALLGILKAGAAFLILDNDYPVSRLMDYLKTANPKGLLWIEAAGLIPDELHEGLKDLGCYLGLPRRSTAEATGLLMDFSTDAPMVDINPDDLAYVTFTSGSNGMPKGVMGTHRPVSHFIKWHSETFHLNENDRFSMLSGLSHDPLLRDIFTPLSLGATLCIPRPEDIAPGLLAQWMSHEEISVAHITPAMGEMLTIASDVMTLKSLRFAFFGGDVLRKRDVVRLREIAPSATCINFYGATETPQAMGYFKTPIPDTAVDGDSPHGSHLNQSVPLGLGISDVQLIVMTKSHRLAAINEQGEIYIRTPYLSLGYLREDVLTRDRFILNPFTQMDGDVLYKTGDLGRYSSNGSVAFMGRIDKQVKIRGFRVELGEIENVLSAHPAVRECVVAAWEDRPGDPSTSLAAGKRLIAYVISGNEPFPSNGELRTYLKERLPEYMLPAAFVLMNTFPLTPNGKIDRQALPPPDQSGPQLEGEFVAPGTVTEKTLADIWREVLGVGNVGIYDNFFDIGGHSLLSIELIARIEHKLGVRLNPRDLMFQTLGQIAALCEEKMQTQEYSSKVS